MATRFYGWEAGTTPITPSVDAGWESSASPFARKPMHTSGRVGDTLATVTSFTSTTGQDRCHRQWISLPMVAGIAFTSGVTTFKAYAQVLESATNDNIVSRIIVRILSEDGSTVRATVLSLGDKSTGTEWNTTIRNKAFADGDTATASYTTVDGDRIVVEWGHNDSAGASISANSRWGALDTATDLGENETDTGTTLRPWFETSATITFKSVTSTTRYVDTASTAGGDGTVNTTSGANRAYESLSAALTAQSATDWVSANQRLRIECYASTGVADTTAASVNSSWAGKLSATSYLEIVGDQPSSLATDTSKYRFAVTDIVPLTISSGASNPHVRVTNIHALVTLATDLTNYRPFAINVATAAAADVRYSACRLELVSVIGGYTHSAEAFYNFMAGTSAYVTYDNCVVVNWTAGTNNFTGFHQNTLANGADTTLWRNCTAYGTRRGFGSFNTTTPATAINCGATGGSSSCFLGTFSAASDYNASSDTTAPGTHKQISVTPTFVSAPSDLHLASGDTAWKDKGTDLSSASPYALTVDGDGATRSGTWDIGADEITGTLYTQTVSGSVTPAGALVRSARKVPAGSLTPAATVTRFTSKTFAGAFTPAGAVAKRAQKTPSGSLTPSAATQPNKTTAVALAGSITPSADLVKQTIKSFAGSLTPVGDLTKFVARSLAGSLAPAGDLLKQAIKTFAGSLTPAGTLSIIKVALRTLDGSLTPAGALSNSTSKSLAGSLTPAGDLVKLLLRSLAGALTPAGTLAKQGQKTESGSLTPTGDVAKETDKTLAGSVTPAGALATLALKAKSLAGTLTPAGDLVRSTLKSLTASLTPEGETAKRAQKVTAGSLTPSASLSKQTNKLATGSLTPTGTVALQLLKTLSLSGSLTPAGALVLRTGKALAGSLAPAGTLSRKTARTLAAVLTPAGALTKAVRRAFAGAFTPSGAATASRLSLRTLDGSLTPTSVVTVTRNKTIVATLDTEGDLSKRAAHSVGGSLTPAGQVSRFISRSLAGSLTPVGVALRRFGKAVSGVLSFVGELIYGLPAFDVSAQVRAHDSIGGYVTAHDTVEAEVLT